VNALRQLAVAAAVVAFVAPVAAGADNVLGAPLPDSATKVAEYRYRSAESFDETIKTLKKIYDEKKFPRKSIINQPGIKALHISNPSGRGYEGLNIYEANDEVRIYVIPAGDVKKKEKKKSK
jgi:hypothetical protein